VRVTTAQPTADPAAELPDAPAAPAAPTRSTERRTWRLDFAACLGLLAIAGWLGSGLWPHPATRALALNATDQALEEWFLAIATRLYTGDFHLVTHLLNSPDGVNLMSNASALLLGAVLTPITLLFGAPVSFAVAIVGNLAGTAIAWYLLFARRLGLHRVGAAAGGAFAAFAPGMMSQSNSHMHMSAQWLVPGIVWCVLRLTSPATAALEPGPRRRRVVATAVALAVLISAQVFVGEEVLFFTALTLLLYGLVYAAQAPHVVRPALPRLAAGLGLAAAVTAALLAYPLWVQFAGPQHVPNGTFNPAFFSADLASFVAVSPMSLAGGQESIRLTSGPTELNTYLGVPLLVVVACLAVWLRRRPVAVAATAVAVTMGAFALGPKVIINGERSSVPGPYALLHNLPVVDGALPSRFALAMIPLIGLVLALALDTALRQSSGQSQSARARLLVPLAVVVALVPIAPKPLPTVDRPPVPLFISEGHWRTCVKPGGVLVPVPPPQPDDPETMRWAAAANAEFGLPEGFFIGPYAAGGKASLGIYPRQLSHYLRHTARTGGMPTVTDEVRAGVRDDLAHWKASCVVLAHQRYDEQLSATLDSMLGPGENVADVRIWRVG
jgi:hypothetical protein